MCTSLTLTADNFYFGRNMDIDYNFGEKIIITPKNFPFKFRKAGELNSHYAIIGMSSEADGYPLYADGANEKGLCMAGLNFPGYAKYSETDAPDKKNIAPFELIPWILGQCADVDEAEKLLLSSNIVDMPFSDKIPAATLHWHIADKNRSIVLENTASGMHIYENPVGVMTNNPTFDFHLTNLGQYLNLTPDDKQNRFAEDAGVKPFGKGLGSYGLPGDSSPCSRFVRTAFLKLYSKCRPEDGVAQFFHILDAAAVVNGSIVPESGRDYMTTYTACMDAENGIYYYKTYAGCRIYAANMYHEDLDGSELIRIPQPEKPVFDPLN